MKKLLPLLVLLGLANGWLFGQAQIFVQNPNLDNNAGTVNGTYPYLSLPGFTVRPWMQYYGFVAPITNWSVDGSSHAIFTVNNSAGNFKVGGFALAKQIANGPANQVNARILPIIAATSTTVTVDNAGATYAGHSETSPAALYLIQDNTVFTGLGTWTVTNTGSQSETFQITTPNGGTSGAFSASPTLASAPSLASIAIGATEPTVTCDSLTTGSVGSYGLHSNIEFDAKWTSADDPTKSGTLHYLVCKSNPKVYASLGYRQAFKNKQIPVFAKAFGTSQEGIDWAITDFVHNGTHGGGDGTIEQIGTNPQAVFHTGTMNGQYELTAYWHADHSVKDINVVYVASGSGVGGQEPSANPLAIEWAPCENDPDAGFSLYEVGPSKAYHSMNLVPGNALEGSALVRLWNEGANGEPTHYNAYWQLWIPTGSFSPHHPAIVECNMPNLTTGEVAIQDGTNAVGNTWMSSIFASAALGNVYNSHPLTGGAYYNGVPLPLSYVSLTNNYIENVAFGIAMTMPDGSSSTWGDSAAYRFTNTQYGNDIGNRIDNTADGIFTDANAQNNAWAGGSLDLVHEGNHLSRNGTNGRSTEHPAYLQTVGREYYVLNYTEGVNTGSGGDACWSSRAGGSAFFMYNRCDPVTSAAGGGQLFGHSEVQDFQRYVDTWAYMGIAGDSTCSGTPYCNGDQWKVDGLAALQMMHTQTNFTIGNIFYIKGDQKTFGFTNTHQTTGYEGPYNAHVNYNTFALDTVDLNSQRFAELTRITSPGNDVPDPRPVVIPQVSLTNNILPWATNSGGFGYTMNTQTGDQLNFQTNLVAPGMMDTSGTINFTYNTGNFSHGLVTDVADQEYTPLPITVKYSGWSSTNFPTYSTYPIDSAWIPPVSSAAVGIATSLTGIDTIFPPLWNAVGRDGTQTRRTDLTTVGGNDPSGGSPVAPTVTTAAAGSITTTTATAGGTVTSDGGASVTARGTCYATTSNPTTPCTSDGTGTGSFTSSLTGLTTSTLYHIRAYATNSVGTSYGSDLTFTTAGAAGAPTVTTTAASSITATTAATGGNVTSDGGSSVTSRGVCYSTSSNPTTPCTSNGTGTGTFSASLSGLTASTLYHIRGFATNSVGTSYGSDLTFTTSAPPPPTLQLGGYIVLSGPNLSLQK